MMCRRVRNRLAAMMLAAALGVPCPAGAADAQAPVAAAAEAPEMSAELARLEKLHAAAKARLAAREYDAAIADLRVILRLRPAARNARWTLVQALAGKGEVDAALEQVDRLLAGVTRAEERDMLRGARRRLLARRPWGLRFGMSLRPSSNVNGATLNTSAPALGGLSGTIDERAQSGVGLSARLGAYRRIGLGAAQDLTLSAGIGGTVFDRPEYDRWHLSGAAKLVRGLERGRVALTARLYRGLYRDASEDFSLAGLELERRVPLGDVLYTLTGAVSRKWYDDAGKARTYDNTRWAVSGAARLSLGARTWARAGLSLSRTAAADDRFSYLAPRATLGLERRWRAGWQLGLDASVEDRAYDAVFGGPFARPRFDRIYGLGVSVAHSRLVVRGFSPRLRCDVTRSRSNVVFYDHIDGESCALSLSRGF